MSDIGTLGKLPGNSRGLLFALAAAAGLAVANLYYNQPVLGLIASDLDVGARIGLLTTVTQLGYTLGLILLVPLCDTLDRRSLILVLCGLLVAASAVGAVAGNLFVLLCSAAGMGVTATITQMVVPMAADVVSSDERGKAIGVAFSGALSGILLARVVSGAIGQLFGWRASFWMATALAVCLWALLGLTLPRLPRKSDLSYKQLLRSMLQLLIDLPGLRYACAIQAFVFGAFSAFWSVLALYLQGEPFRLGPGVAGAFGLVGVVGVLAAQAGGRLTDRYGARSGVLMGTLACVVSFALMGLTHSLALLIVEVVILDAGVALAQVSNQSLILGLSEAARGRINTVYVTVIFFGGALGSALASYGWSHARWTGVVATGGGMSALALLSYFASRRAGIAGTRAS
ncbi:MFS transporter [Burkholderia multivorans]|uniref:MFS transporter n=1 Tax=Burkholderia multivorans TaxID=87883 RepID=UPI001238B3EA|nr:MFS transporter [Burkholderia multivorans]QET31300.1 MFS transporter [Burkholderia multivorans]QET41282.1 MFS transporter [Burkholderia multivorans]UQN70217.1 MFS transporter [Burkholderia multivorans]UQN75946.1 MFS transporter [Burkholderia multivorans]